MEWQPIETAPQDGTEILIAGRYDFSGVWDMAVGDCRGGKARPFVGEHTATHWMPLPAPPQTKGNQS